MTDTPDNPLAMFTQRYADYNTPWDTNITPPEIVAVVDELPPGRALDLGCGTGTNVRYLVEHGWQADGVDFVAQAIDTARIKLAAFPPDVAAVYCHDVTQLDNLTRLRPPYDLIVDIGCGHGIAADKQADYARAVAARLAGGGTMMLYAHGPAPDHAFGWTPDDVRRLFGPYLRMVQQTLSTDTAGGWLSGWYRLHNALDEP